MVCDDRLHNAFIQLVKEEGRVCSVEAEAYRREKVRQGGTFLLRGKRGVVVRVINRLAMSDEILREELDRVDDLPGRT